MALARRCDVILLNGGTRNADHVGKATIMGCRHILAHRRKIWMERQLLQRSSLLLVNKCHYSSSQLWRPQGERFAKRAVAHQAGHNNQ